MTDSARLHDRLVSPVRVDIRHAPHRTLHGEAFQRSDCNSPIHIHQGKLFAFVSHYLPIGHAYRRIGDRGFRFNAPLEPVRIVNDPDPSVGKWIESTWRDPSGRLYGWYHAETLAPCARRLFIPHIGALHSDDDGATWHLGDLLLRPPADMFDCGYQNGFLAGGYGDFTVIPDRPQAYFYLHFSSYLPDERTQGIAVARYPVRSRDNPAAGLEIWRDGAWRKGAWHLPTPFLPATRGWKHPDPDAFWGPAVHYNRDLRMFVMLLNHTQNGQSDIRQEGVYCSFNKDLSDPEGWSVPICIIKGGGWYPQVIGLGPEDGDTSAGSTGRFFMTGFSAWEIQFSRSRKVPAAPVEISWSSMLEQFSRGPHGIQPAVAQQRKSR